MSLFKTIIKLVNNPGQTVCEGDTNTLQVYQVIDEKNVKKIDEIKHIDQDVINYEAKRLGHKVEPVSWLKGKKVIK